MFFLSPVAENERIRLCDCELERKRVDGTGFLAGISSKLDFSHG